LATFTTPFGGSGYVAACMAVVVGSSGGSLEVSDSTIDGSTGASCDEVPVVGSGGVVVSSGGATVRLERSLVVGGAVQQASLIASQSCEDGAGRAVDVQDSTIVGATGIGFGRRIAMLYAPCSPTGSSTASPSRILGSTLDGELFALGPAPSYLALEVGRSALTAPLPGAPCTGPAGSIESLGDNTANGPCGALTATGDETDVDPQLGPLGDNGGATPTYLPLPTSPLIDTAGGCAGVDQRGVARPQGAACDRGAVEVEQ
jgi:hypothetical protein